MNSIEEIVEDSIKSQLNTLKIPYYAKTQGINTEI